MVSKGTPFTFNHVVEARRRHASTIFPMKSILINRLNNARKELVDTLGSISPEAGITEAWTVKEVLAHIAGWDQVSTQAIQTLIAGQAPRVTVPQGIHAFNAEMAAAWMGKNYQQALQEFNLSRQAFIMAIESLPENLVDAEFTLPWGGQGTLEQIVDILAKHELEHIEDLKQAKG